MNWKLPYIHGRTSSIQCIPQSNGYNCVILICGLLLGFTSCKQDGRYSRIYGETMGTYYAITIDDDEAAIQQADIDSLLEVYNLSLSTYIPRSTISRWNTSTHGMAISKAEPYFFSVFNRARTFYDMTDGLYDPTVMPLVNYWGFGYKDDYKGSDTLKIDSIKTYVGLGQVKSEDRKDSIFLMKSHPLTQLDFSSIAKGNAIDVLAAYLDARGIKNYLIDIGGEARALGKNKEGKPWVLAVNRPKEASGRTDIELVLSLDNMSIASSGNYRNYKVRDGIKVSHTINPLTGFPERSNLLGATVIADNCTDADALATCLMVLGLEKSKAILNKLDNFEACLIYDEDGDEILEKYYSHGFQQYLLKQ